VLPLSLLLLGNGLGNIFDPKTEFTQMDRKINLYNSSKKFDILNLAVDITIAYGASPKAALPETTLENVYKMLLKLFEEAKKD
jgi:hypothetical protein